MLRQAGDVTAGDDLDGGYEEVDDEEVDDYYYPSMSYSALLSTKSPVRFSAPLPSPEEITSERVRPEQSSETARSNVAVERYEHETLAKDESYPITSWENKWFDHAALLGRCMAQDKIGCTVDRISMLKCHHSSQEQGSCVLCEPIDWTERPATNAPDLSEEKNILTDSDILTEYSEALLECSIICDELISYDSNSQSASVPSPCETSGEASVLCDPITGEKGEGELVKKNDGHDEVSSMRSATPDEAGVPQSPEPETVDVETVAVLSEQTTDSDGGMAVVSDGGMAVVSGDEKELPTCGLCQAQFNTPYSLWYHTKLEHSTQRYQCGLCDKNFVKKQQLTTHIKAHMNIKAFTCSFKDCKKSFLTAQHLRNHAKIHTGEKPYQCEECNKSFREKSSLKKHYLTHSGVKRYQCDLCGKAFAQSGSRSHHRKTQHLQSSDNKSQKERQRLTMEIAQIVELE